jgi:hypothetical protein
LRGHGLHLGAMLGFGAGSLDLGMLDGLDPRRVLATPLFFGPAHFLRFARLALVCFTSCSLIGLSAVTRFARLTLLRRRLLGDSLLLEIHEFFQREEN